MFFCLFSSPTLWVNELCLSFYSIYPVISNLTIVYYSSFCVLVHVWAAYVSLLSSPDLLLITPPIWENHPAALRLNDWSCPIVHSQTKKGFLKDFSAFFFFFSDFFSLTSTKIYDHIVVNDSHSFLPGICAGPHGWKKWEKRKVPQPKTGESESASPRQADWLAGWSGERRESGTDWER